MIYVTDAEYISDYKIKLRFNDAREGMVDLKDIIHNDHRQIFRELENISLFKDFHVEMDIVVWKNGLYLAPEFLWERVFS
jgi:hypothetical protein